MGERDLLSELSQTVAAYLNTVQVVSETIEAACPEVGRPYHKRIMRLRSRVAFEATPAAIHESADALHAELAGYASASSQFMQSQNRELRNGIAVLEQSAESLAKRVDYYASSLRQLAKRLEMADQLADAEDLRSLATAQATALRNFVESMTHETASLLAKSRAAIHENAVRLANAQVTDDTTGVISRHEMERQIDARRNADIGFTPLRIAFSGPVDDDVMRQAAAKIMSQFRHNDLLGRWSDSEFLLLFAGNPDLAQTRASQVLPWISGTYAALGGGTVEIDAAVELLEAELVLA